MMKLKPVCCYILVFAMLIAVSPATAVNFGPNPFGNEYLEAYTADNGRFTIGTGTVGNPVHGTDENVQLLYGHDRTDAETSCTIIRIGNIPGISGYQDMLFRSDAPPVTNPACTESEALMTVDINGALAEITQRIMLVVNPKTGRYDQFRIQYELNNISGASLTMGVRILLDTDVQNDAAPFAIPGIGHVTTETELTGAAIPQEWQVFDDLFQPKVEALGMLYQGTDEKPDKVQWCSWADIYGTNQGGVWDYQVKAGKDIGDSAVAVYFNPADVAGGQTRVVATYYGLGDFVPIIPVPVVSGYRVPGYLVTDPKTNIKPLLINGTQPAAYINLLTEQLEFAPGYESLREGIRTYSTYYGKSGTTWAQGMPTITKMLNKESELILADGYTGGSGRHLNAPKSYIKFPVIAARPKLEKYSVNYALMHTQNGVLQFDITGTNFWTLASKDGAAAKEKNLVMKIPPGTTLYRVPTIKIPVNPLSQNGKVQREKYTYSTLPEVNYQKAIFVPSIKWVNFTVSSELKATTYKIDYKKETLKLKRGDLYSLDSGATTKIVTERNLVLDISSALDRGIDILVRKAPAAKKPASALQIIEVAPRSDLTSMTLTCANGKIKTNMKNYEVYIDGKWVAVTKVKTAGTYDIRLKATAKTSKNVTTGYAASASGKLLVKSGVYDQAKGKSGIISAQILPTYTEAFPDPVFRDFVLIHVIGGGRNAVDTVSSADISKLAALTSLNVASLGIADMSGLGFFTGLTALDCSGNLLTVLDVSGNPALLTLNCANNQLTSLDISSNNALTNLECYGNRMGADPDAGVPAWKTYWSTAGNSGSSEPFQYFPQN